jgi:hypothetical protein
MRHSTRDGVSGDFVVTHPLDPDDARTVAAMRAAISASLLFFMFVRLRAAVTRRQTRYVMTRVYYQFLWE